MPATAPTGAVVTTTIPYRPIGPWIDGCVPDSIRYVPGLRGSVADPKVRAVVAPAATCVENDCTRFPCAGGVNERLLVRFMVSVCPAGTVITTGDQVEGTPTTADAGFNAAQVAAGAR